MRNVIIFSCLILWNFFLYGQDYKPIIVKKGTTLLDYFSPSERYLYPEFTTGKVLFKTNAYWGIKLNYDYMNGEIEFLQNSDTLTISDKKDLMSIIIAEDTFFYDNGYILQIKSGHPKIGLKESIEFKEYMKKDGYGTAGAAGARTSYSSISTGGESHKLTADEDLVYRRTKVFYLLSPEGDFDLYNKKNVCKMFPKNKEKIKSYLKSNKIKFNSEEDLLKLAEFLEAF
jgi:hypothetical protein